ncbi:MAG: hypothetical protein K2P49_13110 [Oscillospiraceae bacterium]|nr:hypothetical protein [Oscillospiraceae bacterium]
MLPISNCNRTAAPAYGTVRPGTASVGPKNNFQSQVREQAARRTDEYRPQVQQAAERRTADQADSAPARKTPSREDLAELAAKYNPRRMTQAEYDSFLENLVDKGILSKSDLDHLGYRGMVVLGPESEGAYSWGVTSRWDVSGMSLSQLRGLAGVASLADAGGDALTMAKLLSLQKPCAATSPEALAFAQESADAYRALAEALEAVQARRGG